MIKDPLDLEEVIIPETKETLLLQQVQLITGRRLAQLFPPGTRELPLLHGMERVKTPKGIFHFDPRKITARDIKAVSKVGRENDLLNLGPFSKRQVLSSFTPGEPELCIVERSWKGIEIRCTITCQKTQELQLSYFEFTKEPDSTVHIEPASHVLLLRATAPASPPEDLSASPSGNTSPPPEQLGCSPSRPEALPPAEPEPEASAAPRRTDFDS